MEIKTLSYSKNRKEIIQKCAEFFADELNLKNSTYKVFICTDPTLMRERRNNGVACKTGDKEITIAVDSRLPIKKLFYTLAHEMVHAKQFARGQYRSEKARNGKYRKYWCGKRVIADYVDQPWEIEAFSRESILVERLLAVLIKNMKKAQMS
jgi:hypothetical protein